MKPSLDALADGVYDALKRAQRRLLAADYAELRLRQRWAGPSGGAGYEEVVVPVVPDPEEIRTVVVFKPDELGDAVQALPAIAELRRHLPDARFFLLCRPLTQPLYERSGLFDEISTFEPGTKTRPAFRSLRQALGRFSVREFDLSVYLRTNPTTFRRFASIPARARLHPIDPRMRSRSPYQAPVSLWTEERKHQVLQLLEIASLVTRREYSFADVRYPPLAWTDDDRRAPELVFGTAEPDPYVVLHMFAKEETRRYPTEYWAPLVDALRRELGVQFVSIGGPEDEGLPVPDGVIQAQGRLTIGQTGYLSSRAAGFVGNLSGPAHLSAALGTPTVTLQGGNSLPVEWAPVGDSLVLRVDVPCSPCHRRTCAGYGLACLVRMTPDRVAPHIVSFLGPRLPEQRSRAATEASLRA
jgi:ADP-heptose:LPS heptosyltransferase